MSVVNFIVYLAIYCLVPAVVIWLCRKYSWLGKLGPIMVLYAIGMLIGNLPYHPAEMATLQDLLPNIAVPLAIPMMLFGCTFSRKELRLQVKLCASGFFAAGLAIVIGYLFFGRLIVSYLDYIIRNNLEDFRTVGQHGTEYETTDGTERNIL